MQASFGNMRISGLSSDGCIGYGLENTLVVGLAMRYGLALANCNGEIRLGSGIGYDGGKSNLISLTVESHMLSSHSYLI